MNILLVDGYNMIHALPDFSRLLDEKLGRARSALAQVLGQLAAAKNGRVMVHVFFDGSDKRDGFDSEPLVGGVEVHFSQGQNADQDILDFLEGVENKAEVTVVTDDRNLAYRASGEGALILSSSGLARRLQKIRRVRDDRP